VVEHDIMPQHTLKELGGGNITNKTARKVGLWAENSLETHINGSSAARSNEMEMTCTVITQSKTPQHDQSRSQRSHMTGVITHYHH
jgi:hypothetical protein